MRSHSCKLSAFLAYFLVVTGHYILAILSIERSILVLNPYKIPPSPKHAVTAVSVLICIVILVYGTFTTLTYDIVVVPVSSPYFNDSASNASLSIKYCGLLLKNQNVANIILTIDGFVYFMIPAILVFVANICSNCINKTWTKQKYPSRLI